MSVFPIEIQKVTLAYKRAGSDKEYHFCTIKTADGRALLIKRWGKAGTWGQMDFVRGDLMKIVREFGKVYREKTGKGYEEISRKDVEAIDGDDFQTKLGSAYYFKLGDELTYLIPGADMTGQKKGEKVDFEVTAGGKYVPKEKPGRHVEAPKPAAEVYAANPLWGAF